MKPDSDAPGLDHLSLAIYAAPNAAAGFAFMLANAYLLKYATDVLGVPLVAMGWIFFVARAWDAVSDPLVGSLSDRTASRWGRRRPWILASSIPLVIALFALWMPPEALAGTPLVLWFGASFVLFFTALTLLNVPHEALGAELSLDYRERNRVFAWRRVAFGVGALGAMGAIIGVTGHDLPTEAGREAARASVSSIVIPAALLSFVLIVVCVRQMRERFGSRARGGDGAASALRDIWRNPHARLLLLTFALQQLGILTLATSFPFFADYVLGDESLTGWLMGVLFVVSTLSIPVWAWLAQRYEKKALMLGSMSGICLIMAGFYFVQAEDRVLIVIYALLAGACAGSLDLLLPSMQADVIDYDEHVTGERKEGIYFAVWSFAQKLAAGFAGLGVAWLLAAAGYQQGVEPDETLRDAIRLTFAGIPFVCYALGMFVFARFGLDSKDHARLRAEIDARETGAAG